MEINKYMIDEILMENFVFVEIVVENINIIVFDFVIRCLGLILELELVEE